MKKIVLGLILLNSLAFGQHIENKTTLDDFFRKLKDGKEVSNVLLIGDSHIQAGYISDFLRAKFQKKYGNAGRGTVFPYSLANSNGPQDFISSSNTPWITFRSVYEQDIYPHIGASGFVMGNNEDSFVEIKFKNEQDQFNFLRIFSDEVNANQEFQLYDHPKSLKDYVTFKKTRLNYVVEEGETFPELAAKFNVVTTRLVQLNGNAVKNPKKGQRIIAEKVEPVYNEDFESGLTLLKQGKFSRSVTEVQLKEPNSRMLLRISQKPRNLIYGFQFLNTNAKNGVVFNTVGVNGATYADFTKYSIQLDQLDVVKPDLVMISLGTNEGVSNISKIDFVSSVEKLVERLRVNNSKLPILLISPTDNNLNPNKTEEVVVWIQEISDRLNVGFLNMFKATGGRGYFSKSLKEKKASSDNVHFLQGGYEDQASLIWKAFQEYL